MVVTLMDNPDGRTTTTIIMMALPPLLPLLIQETAMMALPPLLLLLIQETAMMALPPLLLLLIQEIVMMDPRLLTQEIVMTDLVLLTLVITVVTLPKILETKMMMEDHRQTVTIKVNTKVNLSVKRLPLQQLQRYWEIAFVVVALTTHVKIPVRISLLVIGTVLLHFVWMHQAEEED